MNFNDVAFIFLLAALVPLLVSHYLPRSLFSSNFRTMAIVGGIAWMVYALIWDVLGAELLGIAKADALAHWYFGMNLAKQISAGSWDALLIHFRPGNNAYQCYVAVVHCFTGTTETFMSASNGWLGFWGGLAMARSLRETFPHSKFSSVWRLAIIFCPSVVFWTTMNVKEGLMYWAICMVFSSAPGVGRHGWLKGTPVFLAGMGVGCLLRPHIMIVWAGAVLAVGLFKKRQFWFAILSAVALLLAVRAFTGLQGMETSVEDAMEFAERQSRVLSATKGGSNIEYGAGGPVVFISGFVALFFRPLPWQIKNLRLLLSCTETWIITYLIVTGLWAGLRSRDKALLGFPQIQTGLIAAFGFCLFFTYTPNEGIIARQRVQALPALFALAVLPRSLRQEKRYRLEALQRMLMRAQMAKTRDPQSPMVPEGPSSSRRKTIAVEGES